MSASRAAADRDRIRVLFVAGTGRSGSTVLSNLLGSIPGFASVGELRYLWERGVGERALCGCGTPVPDCAFWRSVLATAYGDRSPDVSAIRAADARFLRLRTFPELLRHRGDPRALGPDAVAYAEHLAQVYRAVAEQSGGAGRTVVVDASKLVSYAYLLRRVAGVEVFLLHLVRDPRGVAYSWSKRQARTDRGAGAAEMGRESPVKSAVLWDVWNAAAWRGWRGDREHYVRVRYEDFVADPAAALAPALALVGRADAVVPVLPTEGGAPGATVDIAESHTVAGNPNRMRTGPTTLAADDAWRTALPIGPRLLVTAVTAPLLHRFGYRWRRAAPPRTAPDPAYARLPGAREFVEDQHGLRRLRSRVARNIAWSREQGLGRVLEEKEIDPLRTVPAAVHKWNYRRTSPLAPGAARPVFLVGVQRSGTNMLTRGLGNAAEVEVHNENDARAFVRYKLRPAEVIEAIVAGSRHSHVLFKPLCDSHRTDELLDKLATASAPRALWAFRDVDGRVRSTLAKFGDGNLQVLREFAAGVNTTRWHVQRISADTAELVRSFDYDTMTPESGAALMWLVRNRLYFELGLDARADVHPVSYNDFLLEPEATMRALCRFLELPYSPALVAHVSARPPTHAKPLHIDARIRAACDELGARLSAAARRAAT